MGNVSRRDCRNPITESGSFCVTHRTHGSSRRPDQRRLGQTDIGNKAAIGGLSREFYRRVREYYRQPDAWKWQESHEYRSGGQSLCRARKPCGHLNRVWLATSTNHGPISGRSRSYEMKNLIDKGGVIKSKSTARISSIRLLSGKQIRGKVFIDCTYEGDLMAAAK